MCAMPSLIPKLNWQQLNTLMFEFSFRCSPNQVNHKIQFFPAMISTILIRIKNNNIDDGGGKRWKSRKSTENCTFGKNTFNFLSFTFYLKKKCQPEENQKLIENVFLYYVSEKPRSNARFSHLMLDRRQKKQDLSNIRSSVWKRYKIDCGAQNKKSYV